MSYQVVMTDNTVFYLGSYEFPKSGMKKNHELKTSKTGVEYIVNNCNLMCYHIF